jgi:hypothetical protein
MLQYAHDHMHTHMNDKIQLHFYLPDQQHVQPIFISSATNFPWISMLKKQVFQTYLGMQNI